MTVHFNPPPSIPARTNPSLSSWAVRLQIHPFGGSQLRSKRRGIQSFRISIRHNRSKLVKNTIKNNHLFHNEIIKNVIKGKSIALMIDQRVREGEKVKFFNNLASTTTIPAQLVKKYNCELVPIYIERKNSNYFKIYISEPIKISKTKSILEITEFLNQVLEKMILKNVDQWIWTHDRWKS